MWSLSSSLSLRTYFKSLSLSWSLGVRSLSLSLSLGVRSLSLSWSLGVRSLSWSLGVRSLLTSLLDCIETEHLIHAHPSLVVYLSLLFNQILVHGRVPTSFGLSIIIPVEKGPTLDKGNSDNYRGITLSSNLSKLFEMCLLEHYCSYFQTSNLQFGFKKGVGCSHAIFAVRAVVDYFTRYGSSVNLCALDMSKAFDKVNHYALFNKLMDRQVPRVVVTTLMTWYSLSAAVVKWDNILSDMITLNCGVRQGGVLSPVLFAVYVNELIEKLSKSKYGCRIGDMFLGCIMYTDDLILISASMCDLQVMTDICSDELINIDMKLNIAKSQILRIGSRFRNSCKSIIVNGVEICHVDKLKYLGYFIFAAKSFKLSLHEMRIKFYRAFNSLYSKCYKFSEPVLLHLVSSHCKPFLLYGMEHRLIFSGPSMRQLKKFCKMKPTHIMLMSSA